MGKFHIDATELCWIDGSADDPEDFCLHGHAVAIIGGETLEYDCTVSATALYLLKTLTENHIIHEDIKYCPAADTFMFQIKNFKMYISAVAIMELIGQ